MRFSIQLAFIAALALSCGAMAQEKPVASTGPFTFRAQAKLVVVDVVVTDRDHHPVHDLKQRDFSILEDHKPQTINSFEERKALTSAEAAKFPELPPMPAGTFSNFAPAPPNSAVNILLLDMLNTAWVDQTFARKQILKYLANAHPGANTAIFGLSTRLFMLQGFTTDPAILRAAVLKLLGKSSPLLDDPINGGLPETGAQMSQEMGGSLPVDEIQTFLDVQNSVKDSSRAKDTLDAMNLLALYLATIPGRKNLIWFSGGFPLSIMPDVTNPNVNPFIGMANVEQEYRETAKLFASSQVAVYPVDARGLMLGSGRVVDDMQLADPHFTMLQMANDTGGHAFIDTNGLAEAVDSAIDDGSSYYTIAYRPSDQTEKGRFRKTEVKLAQQGYHLEYRRGYYEDDPRQSPQPETIADTSDRSLIFRAMVRGVPSASEILFKARVVPAAKASDGQRRVLTGDDFLRRYAVDFAVMPNDIAYTTTADGIRHFHVEFITVAYRSDGAVANRTANDVKGALTPTQFSRLQQTGFPFHQEINVPLKGDYSIRLGIHDLNSNHIGTTELPVAGIRDLPPAISLGASR